IPDSRPEPRGGGVQFFVDAGAAIHGVPAGKRDLSGAGVRVEYGVVASGSGWYVRGIRLPHEVLRGSASHHRSIVLRVAKTIHQGGAVHRGDVARRGWLAIVGLRTSFAILGPGDALLYKLSRFP